MTMFIYSIEAFVFATMGIAWASVRNMLGMYALLDDFIIYSQLVLTIFNFLALFFYFSKHHAAQAYFTMTLSHFLFFIYAIADSMVSPDVLPYIRSSALDNTSMKYYVNRTINTTHGNVTNTTFICCPNQDVRAWNRNIYFGGMDLYIVPSAITLCFQTIHVFIAAGALTSVQNTVWPGEPFAFSVLTYSAAALTFKYTGLIHPPCPPGTIVIFDGFFSIELWLILMLFTVTFSLLGASEDIIPYTIPKLIWNVACFAVLVLYVVVLWANVSDTNIMTYTWMAYSSIGFLGFVYSYFQPDIYIASKTPYNATEAQLSSEKKFPRRQRFVMPLQTDISPINKPVKENVNIATKQIIKKIYNTKSD
jgi:hypothetical protein